MSLGQPIARGCDFLLAISRRRRLHLARFVGRAGALAVENRKVSLEVRELHFGRRPNVFRVVFHIVTFEPRRESS